MHDLKNLKCLLPNTKALLLKMIDGCDFLNKYVLVGGSALALHLCHRKSEDLVFFTYDDSFDKQEIFKYIKQFENKEILNQTDEQVDLLLDGVKVTFFNAQWSFLKPKKIENFKLFSVALLYTDNIEYLKPIEMLAKEQIRDFFQFELDKSK